MRIEMGTNTEGGKQQSGQRAGIQIALTWVLILLVTAFIWYQYDKWQARKAAATPTPSPTQHVSTTPLDFAFPQAARRTPAVNTACGLVSFPPHPPRSDGVSIRSLRPVWLADFPGLDDDGVVGEDVGNL